MGREFHIDGDFDGQGNEPEQKDAKLFNANEARVAGVVKDILGQDVTDREQTFESLGADSLDYVEIVMAMEEEFDITIADDEAQDITTVGGLMDLVEKLDGFK